MGTRNVYFYSVELKKVCGNEDVTGSIKEIFKKIFDVNSIRSDNMRSLNLQSGQVTLDILQDTENFLFARVGKQTEYYNIVRRDKSTMKSELAIDTSNSNQVLEVCTYFLLDYTNGIVGFIFGKSAPTPNALISIITDYDKENFMSIARIASPESVRALLKPGSTLKKVKYIMRTPNIEILEHLKIRDSLKAKMIQMEKQEIEIIIKNNNKSVFSTLEETREFIEDIFSSDEKEDISLIGNSGKSRQKEFKFLEQDISYPIEIKEYELIPGTREKRRLDDKKINENVYNSLKFVYNSNQRDILMFAGMDYNE